MRESAIEIVKRENQVKQSTGKVALLLFVTKYLQLIIHLFGATKRIEPKNNTINTTTTVFFSSTKLTKKSTRASNCEIPDNIGLTRIASLTLLIPGFLASVV